MKFESQRITAQEAKVGDLLSFDGAGSKYPDWLVITKQEAKEYASKFNKTCVSYWLDEGNHVCIKTNSSGEKKEEWASISWFEKDRCITYRFTPYFDEIEIQESYDIA